MADCHLPADVECIPPSQDCRGFRVIRVIRIDLHMTRTVINSIISYHRSEIMENVESSIK
jgi:hypothetical protein